MSERLHFQIIIASTPIKAAHIYIISTSTCSTRSLRSLCIDRNERYITSILFAWNILHLLPKAAVLLTKPHAAPHLDPSVYRVYCMCAHYISFRSQSSLYHVLSMYYCSCRVSICQCSGSSLLVSLTVFRFLPEPCGGSNS